MTTIRALVLAEIQRGPKTTNELLDAIDAIENPRQLSNCLHNLRTNGHVTRDDDGRYRIGSADNAVRVSNPIVDAVTRMPAPAVVSSRSHVADAASYVNGAIGKTANPKPSMLDEFEEAECISKRITRAAAGIASPRTAVRAILERSVEANQAALDDYVASVADPRILGPLRNARDQARAALAALDNAGSPSC